MSQDEDLTKWSNLCAATSVRGALPAHFRAFISGSEDEDETGYPPSTLVVRCVVATGSRRYGILPTIRSHAAPPPGVEPSEEILHDLAATLYLHELDEQWTVRTRHPHAAPTLRIASQGAEARATLRGANDAIQARLDRRTP